MTIALNNTDVIEGGASVASVVDYTISGIVGTTITRLASGTLSDTLTTALYTAGAAVGVSSIVLVNTHSAAVDVTFRLDPADGGNPRYLFPETVSLGTGYSLRTNGTRCEVHDASGNLQTLPGLHAALHKDGGADELLNDPGAIGGDTPAAGAFTTVTASTPIVHASGGSGTTGDSIVKAWIQFNGTGVIAIQDSYNVTSITDNGTGGYTVTWDTDFANDDYAVSITGNNNQSVSVSGGHATGTVAVVCRNVEGTAAIDLSVICVIGIGDQ